MRLLFILVSCAVLLACGGGGSDSGEPPVAVPAPTVPLLTNSYVQCGEFFQGVDNLIPRTLSAPSDWVVMGSSSAVGAGASTPDKSWVGLLQSDQVAAQAQIHNIARGGYTTYQALSEQCVVNPNRRQPDAEHNIDKALTLAPDLVLLSFPSNDAALGYSATETAANILLLRQQLADQNTALLVLSAQPRNMAPDKQKLLTELDRLLKPVLTDCFVAVYAPLAGGGGLAPEFDSGDGVHLNDAGHALVFNAVKAALQSEKCLKLP